MYDSLYCDIHFILVVWNRTGGVSEVCLKSALWVLTVSLTDSSENLASKAESNRPRPESEALMQLISRYPIVASLSSLLLAIKDRAVSF